MYHARVMRTGRPSRLFPPEAVARRVRLSTASLYQSSTPLPCRPATVMSGSAGVSGDNPKAPKDPSEGLKELYITAARYRQESQQATTEAERKELLTLHREGMALYRSEKASIERAEAAAAALDQLDTEIAKLTHKRSSVAQWLRVKGVFQVRAGDPSAGRGKNYRKNRRRAVRKRIAELRQLTASLTDLRIKRLRLLGYKQVSAGDILKRLELTRQSQDDRYREPPMWGKVFHPLPAWDVGIEDGQRTAVRIWSTMLSHSALAPPVVASTDHPVDDSSAPEDRPRAKLAAVVATPGLGKTLALQQFCRLHMRLAREAEDLHCSWVAAAALDEELANEGQTLAQVADFAASCVVFGVNFNDNYAIQPEEYHLVNADDAYVEVPLYLRFLFVELAELRPGKVAEDFKMFVGQACAAIKAGILPSDALEKEVNEVLSTRGSRGGAASRIILAVDELGKARNLLPPQPYQRRYPDAAAKVLNYDAADGLRFACARLTDTFGGLTVCTSITSSLVERELQTPLQRSLTYVELEGPVDVRPLLRRALEQLGARGLHLGCFGWRYSWKVKRKASREGRDVSNPTRLMDALCALTGGHPRFAAWAAVLLSRAGPGASVWDILSQAARDASIALVPSLDVISGTYTGTDEFFTKIFRGEQVRYHDNALSIQTKDGITQYSWDELRRDSIVIASGGSVFNPLVVPMQLFDVMAGTRTTTCDVLKPLSYFAPSSTSHSETWEWMAAAMEVVRSVLRSRRPAEYRATTLRGMYATAVDGKALPVTHVGDSRLVKDVQLCAHLPFKGVRNDKSFEELLKMASDSDHKEELQQCVWLMPGNEAGIDAVIFFKCASDGAGVKQGDLIAVGLQFKSSNLLQGNKTVRQLNGQMVQDMWDKLCPVLGGSWEHWQNRFALVVVCRLTKANTFDASKATPIKPLKEEADERDVERYSAAITNRQFAQQSRVGQTVVLTFDDLKDFYGPVLFPVVEAGDLLMSEAFVGSTMPSDNDGSSDGGGGAGAGVGGRRHNVD